MNNHNNTKQERQQENEQGNEKEEGTHREQITIRTNKQEHKERSRNIKNKNETTKTQQEKK